MNNNSSERTLSIIKPDAVERELETKIKKIFLNNKLNIVDSKKIQISKEEAEKFYKVHQTKPFYEKLCSYLSSGPIIAIILDGENAIQKNRDLMGATDPKKAKDGTIRKLYGISIDKNSVHGSDSLTNAKAEIDFFFN
jgi:nucleoside-diphosphate kinase